MKRGVIITLIIALTLIFNVGAKAQTNWQIIEEAESNKWYSPDYFTVQHAGNIGFMSIGLGYEWWREIAQSAFIYGFVPENHGDATIHTFTIKNSFRLYEFKIGGKYNLSPTLGFSLSLEPGENSYMRVPERYPDGYYGSNSFYACLNLGLKSHFRFKEERRFSGMEVFGEINTLADYVYYNIIAQEDRSSNIGSYALGVNIFF